MVKLIINYLFAILIIYSYYIYNMIIIYILKWNKYIYYNYLLIIYILFFKYKFAIKNLYFFNI